MIAKQFIIKVAQSFENFKNYLNNDKLTIDYTYLWDLICMPNEKLFTDGLNLIILEIPEDDATNNVELVCPTNHYSVHTFNEKKKSLFLIKRENYFEPIYGYRNDGKNINITKTFNEFDDNQLPKTLRSVFDKIIKPTLGKKCRALLSRPNEYRFNQSPVLDKLIEILQNKKYNINTQILNFQGKVIGVLAKNKKALEGFIPCYPSALTSLKNKKCGINAKQCDYEFVYMNDDIWKSYEETLKFLKEYYEYEEPEDINKANCYNPKYFCKVVENELITGFLTNTNQFIPIKAPIPITDVTDTIKTITNNDMLVADINTLTNNTVDYKRVNFIKKIQLETNFFNVFRNTIRILLNDYSNSEKRKKIKEECNKKYTYYKTQLDLVINMLRDLVDDTIVFAKKHNLPYTYEEINENEIHTCLSKKDNNCVNNENPKNSICRMTSNTCQLVIPKLNLVNRSDNEKYYYGKMADELIRYNRIKSFIFNPQAYLSFGQIKYNLRGDEIIVLQDLLNAEFFEKLIPSDINIFAKYNTFDTAEPIITKLYNNEFDIDEIIDSQNIRNCVKSLPLKIKTEYWRNCFPNGYKEIEYKDSNICSLYLIIDIVEKIKQKKINLEEVKKNLLKEYEKITNNFTNNENIDKIINILKEERQIYMNKLNDGSLKYKKMFQQMIQQNEFVAVNFDLWLLLAKYEIPSIFISNKPIAETRFINKEFVCYTANNVTEYVFIIIPAMLKKIDNNFHEYKLIVTDKTDVKINIDNINEGVCKSNIQTAIDSYITIDNYIENYIVTQKIPKQKGTRNIEYKNTLGISIGEKKNRKLKAKKINYTLVLEEGEEVN